MNLLRIITSMDPASGGPCQGIRNSIPELEKLNVRNEVLCLDDPNASFVGKDPFPVHAIGRGKGPWSYSSKLIPWLLDNLNRFDAVIVEGLWQYHSYGTAKALNIFKKIQLKSLKESRVPKLFIMPHGMLDPYFQKAPERKLKAIRNWIYWKMIEGKVVNNAFGLLFTCEAELLLARESFRPYLPQREINAGFGIQAPPAYAPAMTEAFLQKCPQIKNRPYILFLGRINEKKGVDLLVQSYLELYDKLQANSEQSRIHLVIAGPGLETSYGQKIVQLAQSNSRVGNSIFFPGMLTGDAKWGAFYGCEAFSLPSHQENFGISVAEALACGKPVLISNQINIWTEIQTGGGGLIAADTLEGTKTTLVRWDKLSANEKTEMRHKAEDTYKKNFAIGPASLQLAQALKRE